MTRNFKDNKNIRRNQIHSSLPTTPTSTTTTTTKNRRIIKTHTNHTHTHNKSTPFNTHNQTPVSLIKTSFNKITK